MNLTRFIFTSLLLVATLGFGKPQKITNIVPSFAARNLYSDTIEVSLLSTKANGKVRKTKPQGISAIGWQRFKISVSKGQFKKGILTFSSDELTETDHKVVITISPYDNPSYQRTDTLNMPYVTRVGLTLDSNKVYFPGDQIACKAFFKYSNGASKPWKRWSRHEQSGLLIQIGHVLMRPQDLKMPPYSSPFKPYVLLRPVFWNNDSIGTGVKIRYKTDTPIMVMKNGRSGRSGQSGNSASNNGSQHGNHGQNGGDGEHGEHAPNLEIYLDKIWVDSTPYIKTVIKESSSGYFEEYYMNPDRYHFTVYCQGGNGGNGGNGGHGSHGMDGATDLQAGRGGNGGNGGYGGHGGDGGRVFIYVTEAYKDLSNHIIVFNNGGTAGSNGSGGRKGKGGMAEKESKTSAIFYLLGSRGGSGGSQGLPGRPGKDGGLPRVVITNTDAAIEK